MHTLGCSARTAGSKLPRTFSEVEVSRQMWEDANNDESASHGLGQEATATERVQGQPVALKAVLGPQLDADGTPHLHCPVCEEKMLTEEDKQLLTKQQLVTHCTAQWLKGKELDSNTFHIEKIPSNLCCECFVTSPYPEGTPMATVRFFHYYAIALLLLAEADNQDDATARVKLPPCVYKEIQRLYGSSAVGFNPNKRRRAESSKTSGA
ncbi:hypothetical protein AB1Y20_011997 [Prymnesium parvum]|uniref:RING-type E3 ubiquitin transferase n=1 Tax=Prymnesium parvum TaxID=97485 RepID=A0AB34IMX7_PRYPA